MADKSKWLGQTFYIDGKFYTYAEFKKEVKAGNKKFIALELKPLDKSKDFADWLLANANAYAAGSGDVKDAIDATGGGEILNQATGGTGVDSVVDFLSTLSNPGLWKRIGIVALGVMLCVFGFQIMIANTKAGKAVTSGVTKVATKGLI